jgi:pimeloyl-ACP methyl ester carboxylesterase
MARGSLGTGYSSAAPSEQQQVITPNLFKGDGTKTGIVYCHSFGALAPYGLFPTVGTSLAVPAIAQYLAECGWPIIGGDLAGDPFGSDTGTARVEEARTYLQGTVGAQSGPVILMGWSEGGAIAMNYARAHAANVAAMVLLQPASDLNDIYIHDRGGVGAAAKIDLAFPPGWDNTADAGYSPVNFAASLAGIPTWVAYASDDPTVIPSTVQTVITGIGSSCTTGLVSTGGHGDGFLSKLLEADGSCPKVANWLSALAL